MKALYKPIWRCLAMALLIQIPTTYFAQDNAETWNAKSETDAWRNDRWSFQFAAGLNSFSTEGIPMSRNQINYQEANPENKYRYRQESRTAGLAYEASLDFKLFRRAQMGVTVNVYKDNEEYLFSNDRAYNAGAIEADSMQKLSIRNLQSYLNLGLRYEQIVYQSASKKHNFFAGLALGWSKNRTPDRTEFDYYAENNFLPADTSSGKVWYFTYTRFNDGFFLAPSIGYSRSFSKNRAVRVSMCQFYQWHSTQSGIEILDQSSSGSKGSTPYTLRAFQLKIGYTF